MEKRVEMLALAIHQHTPITIGGTVHYAVPTDVLLDTPEGRKVISKREFDQMVIEGSYEVGEDIGYGWVRVTPA